MEQDASTRHVLEGRELIDYLVEKASGATNAELLNREDRRNRRTAAVLSVLTFVGLGAIVGAIKMFVQQEITQSELRVREQVAETLTEDFLLRQADFERVVADSIAERVDLQVGAVRRELDHYKLYQELIAHAELIDAAAGEGKIADKSLVLAIDAVRTLADVESIRAQPRFLEAVNVVVGLLVRTDRKREIDELESRLAGVLGLQKDITLDLADHYGELIVASPYPVEELTQESEALARYARAAREHKYPEKALMWELFVAFKAAGYQANRTTESLVAMTRDLNEQDLNEFCYQVVLHSHPLHWMQTPDHEGRELARLVAGLLRDHPELHRTIEAQSSDQRLSARLAGLAQRRRDRSPAPDPVTPETPIEETMVAAPPAERTATPSVADAEPDNVLRR